MGNRAFIIHGRLGYPEEAWLPWLKLELEKKGYEVALPAMPDPARPMIREWIGFISKLVGEPDEKTVMAGHSLGCQAVLRYLETVGASGKSVRRTVLVAGSYPTGMPIDEARERADGNDAMLPWFSVGVDATKVRKAAGTCTVILSDDDPYIPLERAISSYEANLRAKIVVEHGKGHFNEDDGLVDLPAALDAVIS